MNTSSNFAEYVCIDMVDDSPLEAFDEDDLIINVEESRKPSTDYTLRMIVIDRTRTVLEDELRLKPRPNPFKNFVQWCGNLLNSVFSKKDNYSCLRSKLI